MEGTEADVPWLHCLVVVVTLPMGSDDIGFESLLILEMHLPSTLSFIWCFLVDPPAKAELMWPPRTQIRFIELECFSASSLDSYVHQLLAPYSTC